MICEIVICVMDSSKKSYPKKSEDRKDALSTR